MGSNKCMDKIKKEFNEVFCHWYVYVISLAASAGALVVNGSSKLLKTLSVPQLVFISVLSGLKLMTSPDNILPVFCVKIHYFTNYRLQLRCVIKVFVNALWFPISSSGFSDAVFVDSDLQYRLNVTRPNLRTVSDVWNWESLQCNRYKVQFA